MKANDFVSGFNEVFSELKGLSVREKLAVLFSPFYLQYYPPKSIKFIGKYFTKDNKCWLLFSNRETSHQPHYATYKEEKDGSISINIKRTDLDKRIHKPKESGAFKVFILEAWEDINNEPIDLEHENLDQSAMWLCNWFCEYPYPDKPVPTLKFRL